MRNAECVERLSSLVVGAQNRTCPLNYAFRTPHSALAFHLYFLTSSGTFSGVTLSMKSSLISTGVAKPHAPRHSTSITVQLPSGLVTPRSRADVCSSNAFTTPSAPQRLHRDVAHTCTKVLPPG